MLKNRTGLCESCLRYFQMVQSFLTPHSNVGPPGSVMPGGIFLEIGLLFSAMNQPPKAASIRNGT